MRTQVDGPVRGSQFGVGEAMEGRLDVDDNLGDGLAKRSNKIESDDRQLATRELVDVCRTLGVPVSTLLVQADRSTCGASS